MLNPNFDPKKKHYIRINSSTDELQYFKRTHRELSGDTLTKEFKAGREAFEALFNGWIPVEYGKVVIKMKKELI